MKPILLLIGGMVFAQTPIADADAAAYWKAQALYHSADAAFRGSLTAQQREMIHQMEVASHQIEAAAKKACPNGLDEEAMKKGTLQCSVPK